VYHTVCFVVKLLNYVIAYLTPFFLINILLLAGVSILKISVDISFVVFSGPGCFWRCGKLCVIFDKGDSGS
jgi:hypothetical protein